MNRDNQSWWGYKKGKKKVKERKRGAFSIWSIKQRKTNKQNPQPTHKAAKPKTKTHKALSVDVYGTYQK